MSPRSEYHPTPNPSPTRRGDGASRFGFDPDRIGVMGGSAGGYLTLLMGHRADPRPRALVSFFGYGELTSPWYTKPSAYYNQAPYPSVEDSAARDTTGTATISCAPTPPSPRFLFYLYTRQQGTWPQEVSGHLPSEREWFEPFEPLRNVTEDYPPTMLLHGDHDTDVPFEQSVMMKDQLAKHSIIHEFSSDPEWGHGFVNDAEGHRVRESIARAVAFLVDHTA